MDCLGCYDTYIGHTLKKYIHDLNRKYLSKHHTAAVTHYLKTGHRFDYDNTKLN